ncbi:MAG: DUF2207 domain-containing protein [Bacteroidales bacterium]|nr:DUF2207 domain-containing protein [Bacteroidales bacterium]
MAGRLITTIAGLLAFAGSAAAYDSAVNDVAVDVRLLEDGSALVSERWDIVAAAGTEWYLVRDNLDDIRISGLQVSDETGLSYYDEGEWDVDRSIERKAGRCGLVHKTDGVEICWGLGSLGPHVFNVSYRMSNVVRLLDDCDIVHMQFVSPGLSSAPRHVKVTVEAIGAQLDTANTLLWGFGYNGTVILDEGKAVFESSEPFGYMSSVISLIRFKKGLFTGGSRERRSFQEVFDKAMEGASYDDYDDDDTPFFIFILCSFLVVFVPILFSVTASKMSKRDILGCNPKDVDWWRDIPYDGNLLETGYTMKHLGAIKKENTMAAALILRMIYKGQLVVRKGSSDKIEIAFGDESKRSELDTASRELYDMMKEASGNDLILQDKEFSRWSARTKNQKRITKWSNDFELEAARQLADDGLVKGRKYTPAGQEKARQAYGFKKFLDDFTLVDQRETAEVHLWQEYLVYASLYGIAEKVAEQLKDIKTIPYEEVVIGDWTTTDTLIRMTGNMSRAITNAQWSASTSAARGGFGGGASFGGGGGFHGGGFGGGAR